MKRPSEVRTSPKEWVAVLGVTYQFLLDQGVGNPLLFGSQAMSFYMANPLRSKDLDLVTDQFGPNSLEELTHALSNKRLADAEVKTNNVQTKFFDGRIMRTYSIEMRVKRRPFFLEIFDAVLDGRPPSILAPTSSVGKNGTLVFGCLLAMLLSVFVSVSGNLRELADLMLLVLITL